MNMWQLAREDPSQCAAHFDCSISVARRLASLTLTQLCRLAGSGRFLFRPVFDLALIDVLAGDADDASIAQPTPEAVALAHAARAHE